MFTSLTASAISYPPINGTTFLYGNSAVNAVGQTSLVSGAGIPYRYWVPKGYTSTTKYPLVMFLHGHGEAGTDDNIQLTAGTNTANGALGLVATANPDNVDNNPCFVVFPQSPDGAWGPGDFDVNTALPAIINTLEAHYSIDANRIALTGLSYGGIGTWAILEGAVDPTYGKITFGNLFSCGIPVSAVTGNSALNTLPTTTPIWAFHAADDTTVGVSGDDVPIQIMRERGQATVYTRYNMGNHSPSTWASAYGTPLLLPWIFAQQKGLPMQGILNLPVTSSAQGTALSLAGNASSTVGFTRIGWTSNFVIPGYIFNDAAVTGNTLLTTTSTTFTSAIVGTRFGCPTANFCDVTSFIDSHHLVVTYCDNFISGGNVTPFPFGCYLTNTFAGTGTGPTWSSTGIPLTAGYNAITVEGEAPNWGINNNGGITTVTFPAFTNYTTHTGDVTPPAIAITSPTSSSTYTTSGALSLSGTASDAGSLGSVVWSSNYGYSGTATGTTSWSISNVPLVAGSNNVITVSVADANGNVSSAAMVVTYTGTSANQPPTAYAGVYQTITWPTAVVTLAGTATDDGLGGSLSTTWSKVSGPGTVTFSNASSLTSTATFSQIGTYVLQLTASDTALTDSSLVTISVLPSGTFAKAINCGSSTAYTSGSGTVYSADSGFSTSGNTEGWYFGYFAGSPDSTLYTTDRVATSSAGVVYNIPLTNGTYDVTLLFTEPTPGEPLGVTAPGSRVFNISAQSTQVYSNVDLNEAVPDGEYAYAQVLPGISVGSGTLNITLSNVVGYPIIQGILIQNSSLTPTAPSITSSAPPGGVVGTAYNFTYTASGTPTLTFSKTAGSLPTGLSLASSTGVLSGTPTTAGTYTGTVTVTNSAGSDSQNFSIVVTSAPTLTGTAPSGTTGTAYSFTYTTGGSPSPTCSKTAGSLPAGLSLSTGGVISGTPTTAATYTGTVTATNGVSPNATQNFSIVISAGPVAPSISGSAPAGTVGTAYSFTYTKSGNPTPTCSKTAGSLPAGLSLSTGGVISGTPTTAATYTGTVTATNGVGSPATDNFSIVISGGGGGGGSVVAIKCGSSSSYTAGDGTVYSADTYFTGGTAFTATTTITTGSDPTLYATYRYGSPTPAVYNIPIANGTYTVHLKYAEMTPTNGVGSRVFGVTVQGTTVESAFDIRAHVAVLTPLDEPYTAVVTNGTLSVGQIYILNNPEFSAILVQSPAPTITNGPPPSTGTSGTAYHFTYTTSGTPTPTFNVSAGSLPTGLTLSTAGVISGTPTASGTFTGTARASNTAGAATQNFSVVISPAQVVAINCGSASNYTAGDGTVYLADTYFSGGSTFTATTTITSGSDPSLYTYYRYGSPTPAIYNIPVANGTYVVHLKYAEMDPTKGVGSRIFGVTVQGTTVESAFDIRAHVAALTALDEPYTAIVTTGTLSVGQIFITGNPEFSAVKVTTP